MQHKIKIKNTHPHTHIQIYMCVSECVYVCMSAKESTSFEKVHIEVSVKINFAD